MWLRRKVSAEAKPCPNGLSRFPYQLSPGRIQTQRFPFTSCLLWESERTGTLWRHEWMEFSTYRRYEISVERDLKGHFIPFSCSLRLSGKVGIQPMPTVEKKKTTHFRCCYRLNRVPQNVYVEALNSNVTALGNRAFKGMVKVKWGYKGRTLIQRDWCPYEERKRHQGCVHRGKTTGGHCGKAAVREPRSEASGKPNLPAPRSWTSLRIRKK